MPMMMLQIRDKSLKITFNFAAQNAKLRIDADSLLGQGRQRGDTGDAEDASSCCTAGRCCLQRRRRKQRCVRQRDREGATN